MPPTSKGAGVRAPGIHPRGSVGVRGPQHRQPQQANPRQENIGEHHCAQFPKPHARTGVKVQVLGVPHGCEHASQIGRKRLQGHQGTASSSCWASFRTASPKGTKVMSDTSLVMAMLQKKGRNTNTSTMRRVEAARRSRRCPWIERTPPAGSLSSPPSGRRAGREYPSRYRRDRPGWAAQKTQREPPAEWRW